MSEPTEDTLSERERCLNIIAKILTHPTRSNTSAALKAIKSGKPVDEFSPPDQAG